MSSAAGLLGQGRAATCVYSEGTGSRASQCVPLLRRVTVLGHRHNVGQRYRAVQCVSAVRVPVKFAKSGHKASREPILGAIVHCEHPDVFPLNGLRYTREYVITRLRSPLGGLAATRVRLLSGGQAVPPSSTEMQQEPGA